MKKVCILIICAMLSAAAASYAADDFSIALTDGDIWKNDSINVKIKSAVNDIYGFQCRFEYTDNVEFAELKIPGGYVAAVPHTGADWVDLAVTLTGDDENLKIDEAVFVFKAQSGGMANISLKSVSVVNSELERTDYTPEADVSFKISVSKPVGGGGGGGGSISMPPTAVITPPALPQTPSAEEVPSSGDDPSAEEAPPSGDDPSVDETPLLSADPIVFADVPETHWAAKYIYKIADKRIITGYHNEKDGKFFREFLPDYNISRAEFVKIIVNALDFDDEDIENPFADVPDTAWYKSSMCAAYKAGIIKGSDGLAMPETLISRQDAAVMLARTLELEDGVQIFFKDEAEIADYAVDYVKNLCSAGIISGLPNGSFNPNGNLKRGEAAAMLARYLERNEK